MREHIKKQIERLEIEIITTKDKAVRCKAAMLIGKLEAEELERDQAMREKPVFSDFQAERNFRRVMGMLRARPAMADGVQQG